MKFTELKKHLSEKKYRPCYILVGDDSFVLSSAAAMLRAIVSDFPEFNLHIFDEASKISDISAAAECLPVMSDFTVVEVRNFGKDTKELIPYLKNPSNQTVLFFSSDALSNGLSPILEFSEVVECGRLDRVIVEKWIKKAAAEEGAGIDNHGTALLIDYCGGFLSRIENELRKLAAYRAGKTITADDVKKLVVPEPEYKMYELSDSLIKKDGVASAEILQFLLSRMPPSMILQNLYSHFRRLLYISLSKDNAEAARYLGIKEYAVKMSRRQTEMLSPRKLKQICDELSAYDFDFKCGNITDKLAVEKFVYGYAGK